MSDSAYQRLPELLQHLEGWGFDLPIRRQISVTQWLLQRAVRPELRSDEHWGYELGPLLCANADEQRRFREAVTAWLETPLSAAVDVPKHTPKSRSTAAPSTESSTEPRFWLRGLAIGTLLLPLVVVTWLLTTDRGHCKNMLGPSFCSFMHGAAPEKAGAEPTELPVAVNNDTESAQAVRQALPTLALSEALPTKTQTTSAVTLGVLAGLPFALVAGAIGVVYRRRRALAHRVKVDARDRLEREYLRLGGRSELFADTRARQALAGFNQPVEIPDTRAALNISASIRETLHKGIPSLQHLPLKRLPQVLLLVQQQSAGDLRLELSMQISKRLRRAGSMVSQFTYRDRPDRLTALDSDGEATQQLRFEDLRRANPDAHVLLMSDAWRLLDLYGDQPLDWTRYLLRWPQPRLLSVEPMGKQLSARLDRLGLQLVPLHDECLSALQQFERVLAPQPLHGLDEEWPTEVLEQARELGKLRRFMGRDGMILLAAVAIYPELHLGLTGAIDRELFGDDPSRHERLLRLMRLPWTRLGWLPDGLRRRLIADLGRERWMRAYNAYKIVFSSAAADGKLPLGYSHRDQSSRAQWRRLRRWMGLRAGQMQDTVALSVTFLGARWVQLAFRMPRTAQMIARISLHQRGVAACALVLAAVSAWPLYRFKWPTLAPPPVATLSATIQYNLAGEARAATIAKWLRRSGLDVTLDATLPTDTDGITLRTVPVRDPLARELREHLRRADPPAAVGILLDGDKANTLAWAVGADVPPAATVFRGSVTQPIPWAPQIGEGIALPRMRPVPAGRFLMGSLADEVGRAKDESPQHEVQVAAFQLAETETTNAEYAAFLNDGPQTVPDDQPWFENQSEDSRSRLIVEGDGYRIELGYEQHPVNNISWYGARAYIDWLKAKTGGNYRLPTEAEWEYAARAGTDTRFYTGDCIHTDQANYDGNYDTGNCGAKTGVYYNDTVAVDTLDAANPWGLRHMAGNVWEWTEDCWHGDYKEAPAAGGAWLEGNGGDCSRRVLRGGAWSDEPQFLRSANRSRDPADNRSSTVGFRLAMTP